ncbi:MAG: sigma-54-dependent Fis family transcriptional regulator [Bacteroidia bacterium]|nr:sigma-54-dependent Fis family transcriptional regulator [Bacteroidia bacterium]
MENKIVTKIFVVEDDEWYREYLSYTLSLDPENSVRSFASGAEFLAAVNEQPDIVTLDYSLPDMTGAMLLQEIKKRIPDAEAIIISEQDKIDTALQLLKAGAYDYFVKSKDIRDRLLNTVSHVRKQLQLKDRLHSLEKELQNKHDFRKNIIGNSPSMLKVFELIEKTLANNLTVTITGETGTGKEEVAKAIHYNSTFSKGPFVAINMAAIPKELAESELFGHEKGAFTGAVAARPGKFEEANNGTIFLDEIGDLDPSLQVKLLRVLQEKNVTRVGSSNVVKVNNRVIVATHKDLREEVKAGRFREDLYYRIFGLTIQLPPLRERGRDVLLLAVYFMNRFCKDNALPAKTLSDDAQQKLLSYAFPGNVRELKSLTELACVLSSGNEIVANDFHLEPNNLSPGFYNDSYSLDDYSRMIIRHYLEHNDQNVVVVAQKLNIGKSTIYRMLKDEKGII